MHNDNFISIKKNRLSYLNIDTDVTDLVSKFTQDSVSDTNQELSANKCILNTSISSLSAEKCSIPNNEEANCINLSDLSSEIEHSLSTDLMFKSKGLHFCNLNVHHMDPKIDEFHSFQCHMTIALIFLVCVRLS